MINKKAYSFKMGKGAQNQYSSRLGLNMFKLPDGEYTLAIEFFPPTMNNVSATVTSSSLNVGQQSTKLFYKYSRSIVHLHKIDSMPLQRIFIQIKCQGTTSSPAQGLGYLIVYGFEGSQSNVSLDIYDALYTEKNGDMAMLTDLSLNTHHIRGVSVAEKDKTSAVSIEYLEEEGLKKTRDKKLLRHVFVFYRFPTARNLEHRQKWRRGFFKRPSRKKGDYVPK